MVDDFVRELITLFVVVDPVGTIPVFLYATTSVPPRLHHRFAIRAVIIATLVLLAFLAFGEMVLDTIGLRLGSFQVAGGIVLFLFALSMIFGETKAEGEIAASEKLGDKEHLSKAVYPLALPSIASPGAMLAIVILTDNNENTIIEQAATAGALVLVLALTLALLLLASPIQRIIGVTGTSVISRVMGIILATVAVDAVVTGLAELGLVGGA